MENFLEYFDFFSGKSVLDRQKFRFHGDYLKARAIFHENMIVFHEADSDGAAGKAEQL